MAEPEDTAATVAAWAHYYAPEPLRGKVATVYEELTWLREALARALALLDVSEPGHTDLTWADRERLLREHRERLGVELELQRD